MMSWDADIAMLGYRVFMRRTWNLMWLVAGCCSLGCSENSLLSTQGATGGNCVDDDSSRPASEAEEATETGGGVDRCGPVSTPEDLDRVLVGTWTGSVYTFDYEAAVTLDFRADHGFTIDFSGDDGNEAVTCSNISDRVSGVSWEVMGPTLVMVSTENKLQNDCGEALERAALTNIWITPTCELTGYSESPSFWDNTNKGIFRLKRQ